MFITMCMYGTELETARYRKRRRQNDRLVGARRRHEVYRFNEREKKPWVQGNDVEMSIPRYVKQPGYGVVERRGRSLGGGPDARGS